MAALRRALRGVHARLISIAAVRVGVSGRHALQGHPGPGIRGSIAAPYGGVRAIVGHGEDYFTPPLGCGLLLHGLGLLSRDGRPLGRRRKRALFTTTAS